MGGWPAKRDHIDLESIRDSTPSEHTIFISPSRARESYHTEQECPHVSRGFYVIKPDDPRHKVFREEYLKCLWCRYDANDTLDLG